MPRQFTKGLDLYNAQLDYFKRNQLSARAMGERLAGQILTDWTELTAGEPIGRARLRLLRKLNRPFARGASPQQSTPTGRRRGHRQASAGRSKAGLPLLPIGVISGRLRRSLRSKKTNQSPLTFEIGAWNPGGSGFVLLTGGTRKTVARGLHAEIRRRFTPRNKALVDTLKARQQQP